MALENRLVFTKTGSWTGGSFSNGETQAEDFGKEIVGIWFEATAGGGTPPTAWEIKLQFEDADAGTTLRDVTNLAKATALFGTAFAASGAKWILPTRMADVAAGSGVARIPILGINWRMSVKPDQTGDGATALVIHAILADGLS